MQARNIWRRATKFGTITRLKVALSLLWVCAETALRSAYFVYAETWASAGAQEFPEDLLAQKCLPGNKISGRTTLKNELE